MRFKRHIYLITIIFVSFTSTLGCSDGKNQSKKLTIPNAPRIATMNSTDSQLSLSWESVSGATAYEVWYSTENNTASASKFGEDVTNTSVVITGLENGTQYYVWLKAKNYSGISGFGPVASGIPVEPITIPDKPDAPIITTGDMQLTVSWTAVSGATAYEVWYNTVNDTETAIMFRDNVTVTSLNITSLENDTIYYVWIKAENSGGTSDFGDEASGTPEPHTIHFTGEELLGIPTATSITINIVPDETIDYYYQCGTSPGVYTEQTSVMIADADQPHEIVINDLTPNTKYFYRMQYRASDSSWITRDEYSFQTQRSVGDTFVFTITADPHATGTEDHIQTMSNLIDDQADFHIDLGDTFMVDNLISQEEVNDAYLVQRDPLFLGGIGHYAPIFLAIGNHEEEEGWNFDDLPFSIALGSVQARKAFFPTPVDQGAGGFYSGNTDILSDIDEAIYGDQYREDYYAWEWGDALFVVIDPYHYTMELPYQQGVADEGYDDPFTGDQWSWTLGAQQFNWFKQNLENSTAKYKFVFSHNVTGGILRPIIEVDPGYVRGGAEAAAYFEWGGYNADGTWGFTGHRDPADFGDIPIHQIMVNNHVSAYFHGHDHLFAYEIRDGIVYQEVPSAGFYASFEGIYDEDETDPDYDTIAVFMYMLGHLRVTVTSNEATVEFVRSSSTNQFINQSVRYAYTIAPAE